MVNGVSDVPYLGYIQTPLAIASAHGHNAVVELLLSQGADLKMDNGAGTYAIHNAARNGHVQVVRTLLSHASLLSYSGYTREEGLRDEDGETPLTLAARGGYWEVVASLIEAGVYIDERNANDETALKIATHEGHYFLVDWLLRHGASVAK